jgi:outer membrane protein assembly factor BamB
VLGLVSSFILHPSFVLAGDWVRWRGPEQTGVSREKDLPDKFSTNADDQNSNLIWKQPYGCRSTPLVLNGRVYIINDAGEGVREQERVMCLEAASGKVLWEHRFNVFFTDIVSNRLGWSNLAADPETGNIYAHGVQGLFFCFDKDGKVLWQHSLTEEYGRVSGYGGRVNSPTVDGDLVIIGMVNSSWGDQARGGDRYLAMDKRTGVPVWWSDSFGVGGTYYSTPVIAVINGERLLITGCSDGHVRALKVRTGELAWQYQVGARSINSAPVVDGTRVYVSHGQENVDTNVQGRVVCLDAFKVANKQPALVWKKDGIKGGYASPVIHNGRLYVCDDQARLFCLDASSGDQLWSYKYGRVAKGSPVWADDKIYVAEVSARFHILKPEDKRCKELHDQFFRSQKGDSVVELNGSPAVSDGRIYFGTRDEMYCIGKPDHKPQSAPVPPMPAEAPPGAKAAHLQVFPADIVLRPGESAQFIARTLDANGELLKEVKAQWSLPAPPPPPGAKVNPPPLKGQIGLDGKLFVAGDLATQHGLVLAKADGLTARARVRVVPKLPYRQDFEKVPVGRTPGGWVNCQGKFSVEEKDGGKVLKKLANNPNPLLARANAFIDMPDTTDYTIQCDLLGTKKKSDLPDMGVVANRYTLMLDGNKQRLRIVSWEALPRVDKTLNFPWDPNVWYRMKLRVDVQGETAVVRGKVWRREEAEPKAWTIEFEDPAPNRSGSPALYGYATGVLDSEEGTVIYYDNLRITPNRNGPGQTSRK